MAKKIDFIQVPFGTVPKLTALFSCSKVTVYRALKYETTTEQAQAIRDAALNQYGGVVSKKAKFI